jgi:hypothetical protein
MPKGNSNLLLAVQLSSAPINLRKSNCPSLWQPASAQESCNNHFLGIAWNTRPVSKWTRRHTNHLKRHFLSLATDALAHQEESNQKVDRRTDDPWFYMGIREAKRQLKALSFCNMRGAASPSIGGIWH